MITGIIHIIFKKISLLNVIGIEEV